MAVKMVFAHLGLLLVVFTLVKGQSPHSCADVYKSDILQTSGVFTIYNRQQQPYQVYCDFRQGYGYTYISPSVSVDVNIDDLYTNTSHVIIRDLRKDGTQHESVIEQINAFKSTPLSIQYNAHVNYQPVLNTKMSPYVYIGMIPKSLIRVGQVEGFRTNGHEATYRNCDNNGNSHFAFLFNQNHVQEVSYAPVASTVTQLKTWDRSLPASRNIPESFYTPFEFHFGGCGGYATLEDFPQFKGTAVGLRYDIMCPKPEAISNGQFSTTGLNAGSSVTYTCDIGSTLLSGTATRVCAQTGKWTGVKPYCGKFPCDSGPCQNGGSCFESEGTSYVCECREGFQGVNCELSQ